VCANPYCPVHHPKKQQRRTDPDPATKSAQEKQRGEEAIANTTGIRVPAAIADAAFVSKGLLRIALFRPRLSDALAQSLQEQIGRSLFDIQECSRIAPFTSTLCNLALYK
jgi:ParB family chromosome partitioning protein